MRPAQLVEYQTVLAELCRAGKVSQAEGLAWAAIETIAARFPPDETLTMAGPFLLAVGESDELRARVAELYRSAYVDRDGLEGLLAESGLAGGRPVRRALRTLNLCLALREGDFLAARDDDRAVRVDQVDRKAWQFTVADTDGAQTLACVDLADRFRLALENEYRVMRVFAPDDLAKQLQDDPTSIIIDICKEREGGIDSDRLEAMLVPRCVPEAEWKKWWAHARSALRRCPHIKIDGRSPHYLTYVETPIALEEGFIEEFQHTHGPLAQLEVVEKYLRECKARGEESSVEVLQRCHEALIERARRLTKDGTVQAGPLWVVAARVGEAAKVAGPDEDGVLFFKTLTDLKGLFAQIENESLLDVACDYLSRARPESWSDELLALLPGFPLVSCDHVASRLVEAGKTSADFERVVQEIMSDPVEHFGALLWLWDGPSQAAYIPVPPPVTLLSRVLRVLDESRRTEKVAGKSTRKVGTRARAVLSARKYEQFDRCLDGLDANMASALRTQIKQLDNLGRAVREDLLSKLNRRFPPISAEPAVPPWARSDVVYVTDAGLARKHEELDHHVNVKMKENARAIGRAAEHGDLSENSEYRFALEERDLLRARLAQMNAEMAAARLLSPNDVPTDHVGIGSKVIMRRVTDAWQYELSILGPWEADPSTGTFSYQTPVAQRILGKRIGDTVEFDHTGAAGTYEVVALDNVLRPGA
jgi:transcription elongation factor GreA